MSIRHGGTSVGVYTASIRDMIVSILHGGFSFDKKTISIHNEGTSIDVTTVSIHNEGNFYRRNDRFHP